METNSSITIENIRDLRIQLMDNIDTLTELEHQFQKGQHVLRRTGKVADTIRSWRDEETEKAEKRSVEKPETDPAAKFLSITEVAERWRCSSATVNRMVRSGIIPKTYLGARIFRIAVDDLVKYEAECRA